MSTHKVGNGAILGIVSEDGLPSAKRITLVDRTNMTVLKKVQSDEYGAYAITGLNPDSSDYLLFAVDDDGDTRKQPLIYDYVQPIPAHQGGFYWGNWYRESMAIEPICSILAISGSASQPDLGAGVGIGAYNYSKGALTEEKESISPAAQSLSTIKLNKVAFGRNCVNHRNMLRGDANLSASMEWLVDTSYTPDGNIAAHCLIGDSEGYAGTVMRHLVAVIVMRYHPATGVLSVYRSPNSGVEQYDGASSTMVNIINYTVPVELRGGVIHFVASILYGEFCTLCVNGVLVDTISLVGTRATTAHNTPVTMICTLANSIDDYITAKYVGTQKLALLVVYSSTLTEPQCKKLYDALFLDSIPVVTGYEKFIIEDYPTNFFRLHDVDGSLVAIDSLRPNNKAGGSSALVKINAGQIANSSAKSIVVGGSSNYLTGGCFVGNSVFQRPASKRFLTIEFTAQSTGSVFTAGMNIICYTTAYNVGDSLLQLRLIADGMFELSWKEGGVVKRHSFTTAISLTDMTHYAIVVDKETGSAYFYINGIEDSSVPVGKAFMDVGETATSFTVGDYQLHIGGICGADRISVSQPFIGYLAEISVYPFALSAATIKGHYDARLVV